MLVAAGVAITSLLLTGCSAIRAMGEQTGIDLALSGLVSTLETTYGVTAVTHKEINAEYQFQVSVTIDAGEVSRDNRVGVITTVDETLGGSAFGSAMVRFSIGTDTAPLYSQDVFGDDHLATDLEYWAAVEAAVGEVSFSISSDPDGDGPLTRARGVNSLIAIDYGLLGSIELDNTALDTWGSPGVSAMGTLPDANAARVLRELTATIPPHDYADPDLALGISLDWTSEPQAANWILRSSTLVYDMTDPVAWEATDPAASTDWPIAVEAASRIAAGGIRGSQFGYFSEQDLGGIVRFGECSTELAANAQDTKLFERLQSAGVVMPPGSAAGWCSGA